LGLEKRVFNAENGIAKLPKWLNGVVVLTIFNSRINIWLLFRIENRGQKTEQ